MNRRKRTHIFMKVVTNGRFCAQSLFTGANCGIKRNLTEVFKDCFDT